MSLHFHDYILFMAEKVCHYCLSPLCTSLSSWCPPYIVVVLVVVVGSSLAAVLPDLVAA